MRSKSTPLHSLLFCASANLTTLAAEAHHAYAAQTVTMFQ